MKTIPFTCKAAVDIALAPSSTVFIVGKVDENGQLTIIESFNYDEAIAMVATDLKRALMHQLTTGKPFDQTRVSKEIKHRLLLDEDNRPVDSFPPTGTTCSECGELQYETPCGVSCNNGHGGAPPNRR